MSSSERYPLEQGTLLDGSTPEYPVSIAPTDDAAVDGLIGALVNIAELPESEQPAAFEQLHDELLSELNTEHT